jgi:hypothetical protein
VPAARARQGMLELCRNLHRLNLLATYRLHQQPIRPPDLGQPRRPRADPGVSFLDRGRRPAQPSRQAGQAALPRATATTGPRS